MFTGIIQEIGTVRALRRSGPATQLVIGARRVLEGVEVGDSLAVNGVCLTVAELGPDWFLAETMPETLRRTNLGLLQPGDLVNLEGSLRAGGSIGGHFVQGHVDGTAPRMAQRWWCALPHRPSSCVTSCPRAMWQWTG